ncbi:MAG TPA: hypothetical protein VJ831_13465, partial [Jatrophihabitantaceae bacterium]|nr:hypothetical protein [Jatrophihabitantaceae bacterium]
MTLAAAIPVDEPIAPAGTALLTVRPAPRREPPFDDEVAGEAAMFPTRFDRPLPFPRAVPGTTPELRPRYDRDLP